MPRQLLAEPDVGFPEVGYNGRGDVVVLVSTRVPTNCEPLGMCAQRLRVLDGDIYGHFGPPVELTDDARDASRPAVGPTGDAAVAWSTFVPNAPGDVLASRRPRAGSWGTGETLGTAMFGQSSVAIDARGLTVAAWGSGSGLDAAKAVRGQPFTAISMPQVKAAAETGVTLAPNGAGAIYWSSGSTSRSAPMYALIARRNGDFRRQVRFRGGAGGAFVAGAGGLLGYWSRLDNASNIHRTVFDPYYVLGSPRRLGRPRAASAHGLILAGGLDAHRRATLLLAQHRQLEAVDAVGRHHRASFRVTATDLANVGFAEAASGHAAICWLTGKPPQHFRVFAAWR